MRSRSLFLLALLGIPWAAPQAQTLPATITLNAGVTVNSFIPVSLFGNNMAYWVTNTNNQAVLPQVQAAGNFFLRYPGGSSSDDYHWNGTGSFDANHDWVPSGTSWSYGFVGTETYRGTTSSYGTASHLTDGNNATTWMSNSDTDFPNKQWVELDLSGVSTVNAVTLVWGTPYAASFQVQYWTLSGWPPPYQSSPESNWITTSAGVVGGTGGTQGVTFTPVAAQYFRVLMTSSSAGAGGAYAIAEARLYNGGSQVSVNNAAATVQTQTEASSTDPSCTLLYTTNPPGSTDFESFMAGIRSMSPQGIPMITVNFGTGTPSEAASWVNYANNVKGYGIKYWQVGNETEGAWETGGPINTQDYVRRYIEFYDAMKAVDPAIVVTGPVAGGLYDSSNLYDGNSVVQDFISLLHAQGKDSYLNAIDFHWYPKYGTFTDASALDSTSGFDAFPASLSTWLSGVAGGSTLPVIMSEYNIDVSDQNFELQLGEGLWVADALGHFIKGFGGRGFTNLWDVLNGGSGTTNAVGGDLGYLNVQNDAYQYQPHASYWAMQMMTHDWAIPGDTQSHSLVSTALSGAQAPASLFAAYSDYRPDGVLSLVVINKNPTSAYSTWITGLPFAPNPSVQGEQFTSANYQWQTGSAPYHAAPDTAPSAVTWSGAAASFGVTFPPYSISVLRFTDSGVATNTPTITPTVTSTPTITATPDYGTGVLVDDFEDLTRDGTPPSRTNLWGGNWGTYLDSDGSSINVQYGVPGADGTSYAARIYGTIVAKTSTNNPFSGYISYLSPSWPPSPNNLSGAGILGIEFWIYGDGTTDRIMVDSQGVTDNDNYGYTFTAPAGVWTFYQIPFTSMTREGWGTQTGLPVHPAGNDITGVQFGTRLSAAGGSYDIRLDQIGFYTGSGVATPTSTWTRTPTRTATATGTPTPTASPSATPTVTGTATDSPSPSITPTGTWYTSTSTDTPSSTWTGTDTPSRTPTVTATSSSTRTWTLTWTATGTYTPSPTPTGTFTPTDSPSPTSTPTWTLTPGAPTLLFPDPLTGPGPVKMTYSLDQKADSVSLKIFTTAFRKVRQQEGLPVDPGSHLWDLGGMTDGLANGLYYGILEIRTGDQLDRKVLKLLVQQ